MSRSVGAALFSASARSSGARLALDSRFSHPKGTLVCPSRTRNAWSRSSAAST